MILYNNDPDIAKRFEGLFRTLFNNCKKASDPWGYASKEFYDTFLSPVPKPIGKKALQIILVKMISDYPRSYHIKRLIQIENKLWDIESEEEIRDLLVESIKILKELKDEESFFKMIIGHKQKK